MERTDRRSSAGDRVVLLGSAEPTLAAEEKRGVRAQSGGDRAAGRNRRVAQRIPSGRGPQQRHGEQRRDGGQAPARETVRDRRDRAGERNREDERQQKRERRAGEDGADHPGEEHPKSDDDHSCGREPRRA